MHLLQSATVYLLLCISMYFLLFMLMYLVLSLFEDVISGRWSSIACLLFMQCIFCHQPLANPPLVYPQVLVLYPFQESRSIIILLKYNQTKLPFVRNVSFVIQQRGGWGQPPFQPTFILYSIHHNVRCVPEKHFNMLTFWPNKSWSYNQTNQLYIAFSFGTIIIINFLVVQSDFAAFWYPLIFFLFFPNYWFFFLSRPFWRSSTIARFSCHVSFVRQQRRGGV